jgi:hypothetical protein
MRMKIPKLTSTQITLGITAIGAIAAIWYYKQSIAAAQGTNQAATPAPLFQTAAIPSFSAGSGVGGAAPTLATDTGGATANGGLSSSDVAAMVSAQLAATGQATQASIAAGSALSFTALAQPIFQQLIAQLPPIFPGDASALQVTLNGAGQSLQLTANANSQGAPLPVYQPPPPIALPPPPPPIIIQNTFAPPQPQPVVGFGGPPPFSNGGGAE